MKNKIIILLGEIERIAGFQQARLKEEEVKEGVLIGSIEIMENYIQQIKDILLDDIDIRIDTELDRRALRK